MIELTKNDLVETYRKSSKGNQFKWFSDGYWYKADQNGYEGLSEYVISKLLEKSSLSRDEYVSYDLETIRYDDRIYRGCRSRSFLKEGQNLITLQRLYQSAYGGELADEIDSIYNSTEKCERFVEIVTNLTGLKDFGEYLLRLLTVDALFLNEDRHFHNIAFIQENDRFAYCPIFDNGAALLSDTRLDYPLDDDVMKLMPRVKSKTIIEDFSEQLTALERLYRSDIEFYFTDQDLIDLMDSIEEYEETIKKRVIRILISQRQRYRDYFKE